MTSKYTHPIARPPLVGPERTDTGNRILVSTMRVLSVVPWLQETSLEDVILTWQWAQQQKAGGTDV